MARVVERGYAVSEVAERLGISANAKSSKLSHVRAGVLDQAAENKRLKRELARVTEKSTISIIVQPRRFERGLRQQKIGQGGRAPERSVMGEKLCRRHVVFG